MQDEPNVSRRDFLQRLSLFGAASIGAGSLLVGCGGGSGEQGGGSTSSSQTSAAARTQSSGGGGSVAKTVTLHPKGNQMKYKETEFTVPAGKKVKVVFENTATSPSMQHNVVVLTRPPEQKVFRKVGEAGMSAGASNDYVPQDMGDLILAHTPMSKPGETVSVTFTTPGETGDYGYICTYPGHWATMQGTMHVR
ncbi:plastocyanin/azurin family copper-binding protein [Salinibacter ruber]|jgi:azurin|uniref:plastocyanin/azurin family copper-binding protein n=1 Tax=Salinibacter ruber TaxID=146919 RepID=UPI000E568417|nr:plastocyanin/azurin family copper-binding protein [Salinibacter ruber]